MKQSTATCLQEIVKTEKLEAQLIQVLHAFLPEVEQQMAKDLKSAAVDPIYSEIKSKVLCQPKAMVNLNPTSVQHTRFSTPDDIARVSRYDFGYPKKQINRINEAKNMNVAPFKAIVPIFEPAQKIEVAKNVQVLERLPEKASQQEKCYLCPSC